MEERTSVEQDPTRTAVANVMRARRGFRHMTQAQLIEKSGLSKSAIERLESGKRDLSVPQLIAIAGALGDDPRDLMRAMMDAIED